MLLNISNGVMSDRIVFLNYVFLTKVDTKLSYYYITDIKNTTTGSSSLVSYIDKKLLTMC